MSSKHVGCGCGSGATSKGIIAVGTGAGGSGDCGCGGAGGASTSCGCNPGVLVQPAFFAGQLLTDADLQALVNYVVTRQRMHNRFLVGSGVACGLAVTCPPCGGGKVVVQPGYAVDCCGNEIMVPCAVELDLNAMVRALKAGRHGQDCGDPCAAPVQDVSPQARAGSAVPVAGTAPATSAAGIAGAASSSGASTPARDDQDTPRGRRYCLYLRYCEEPTDVVAPYTQDDSCAVTCQPSRLREGFVFELRCPADDPAPPSFVDRLEGCIGDLRETDRKAADIERVQAYMQRNRVGIAAWQLGLAPQFDSGDATIMINAVTTLSKSASDATAPGAAPATGTNTGTNIGTTVDTAWKREQLLRTALDDLHAVGAATARFSLLTPAARKQAFAGNQGLENAIKANVPLLAQVAPALDDQAGKVLTSPFELALAHAVTAQTQQYADPGLTAAGMASQEASIYAYNGVVTPAANQQAHQAMASFQTWLLRKIDMCPPVGACCLDDEIGAIRVPTGDAITEDTVRAADKLVRGLIRYLFDCICAALLPPCPTCDDPAVKLACVQIDDCNVAEICNLERTFLLTEPNLRYWLPLLHAFGEGLERLCCDVAGRVKLQVATPAPSQDAVLAQHQALKQQTAFFKSGAQLGTWSASTTAFPTLARLAGLDVNSARAGMNIGGNIARVAARDPVMKALAASYTNVDPARLAGTGMLARAFAASPASDVVRTEVDRAIEGVQVQVDAHLQDVHDAIDQRLAPESLSQAQVIVDLKAQLDAQREVNEKLGKRLDALEKRKTP